MAQNSQVKTNRPAKRARNSKKGQAAETVILHHTEEVVLDTPPADEVVLSADTTENLAANDSAAPADNDSEANAIDQLLADLDAPTATVNVPAVTEASDEDLHAAVNGAEAIEASHEAATPDAVDPGAEPTGDSSDVQVQQPAADAGDAAAKPKRTPTPRKHYSDKTERLKDRVGADLPGYTVLTLADATVDPAELQKRMDETIAIIKGMNKKEQVRATGFIEFLSGKKAKLNEVLERALKCLDRDGHVSMGKDGNLMKDLIARPYSPAAARAMGGNTLGMFEDLKVIQKDPANKGRFIANPESALLITAMGKITAAQQTPAGATA